MGLCSERESYAKHKILIRRETPKRGVFLWETDKERSEKVTKGLLRLLAFIVPSHLRFTDGLPTLSFTVD